jgi:hypothetical protein
MNDNWQKGDGGDRGRPQYIRQQLSEHHRNIRDNGSSSDSKFQNTSRNFHEGSNISVNLFFVNAKI